MMKDWRRRLAPVDFESSVCQLLTNPSVVSDPGHIHPTFVTSAELITDLWPNAVFSNLKKLVNGLFYSALRKAGHYGKRGRTGRNDQPPCHSKAEGDDRSGGEVLRQSRSEFMLEAACREAETVLLDCRYFGLSPEAFKRFTAMLDKLPASNLNCGILFGSERRGRMSGPFPDISPPVVCYSSERNGFRV